MSKAQIFIGKPCKRGGHTERYVTNRSCVVCKELSNKKRYAENKEKMKAQNKKWQKENKGLCNHKTALRKSRKKQQTPPWADLEKIKQIYINCPEGYEVDHKHPLSKGGLHVDYNLQSIPISENRSKGAKLDYDTTRF